MDTAKFYADLKFILDQPFRDAEFTVRRWSGAICNDYEIPLVLVCGLLRRPIYLSEPFELFLSEAPTHIAVKEIFLNSHLSDALTFDAHKNCITFKKEIPSELILEVADFVIDNGGGAVI